MKKKKTNLNINNRGSNDSHNHAIGNNSSNSNNCGNSDNNTNISHVATPISFDQILAFLVECFLDHESINMELLTQAAHASKDYTSAIDWVLTLQTQDDWNRAALVDGEDGHSILGLEDNYTDSTLISPFPHNLDSLLAGLVEHFPDWDIEALKAIITANPDITDPTILAHQILSSPDVAEGSAWGKKKRWHKLDIATCTNPQASHFAQSDQAKQRNMPLSGFLLANIEPYSTAVQAFEAAILNIDECKLHLDSLYEERSRLLNRAAQAYANGGISGRSIASYYADESKSIQRKIDRIDILLAWLVFAQKYPALPS